VVLDIGCGNGLVTQEEIFPLVGEGNVTGIDPSAEMIGVADTRTIPEKLVFRTGSAEGTGFAPNTFDAVTCFSTLHWVEQKDLAIREVARVLKPGGLYYVYMWVRDAKDPIRQAFESTARSGKWFNSLTPHGFFPEALPDFQGKFKEPYHMTRRNKINQSLKSASFEILVWEPHMSNEVFETAEDLKDWLLGWSQFGCLEERHEEFLRDVVKNYLVITEQSEEDEINYHDAKLRFVARKLGSV
jgi:ubiquinone/menaquinone biosynthesis C-methylase UbiE